MHVTTFYSYKGGVGRTMALVNVAALLASSGRRVLVVDLDLEAPGVPTYEGLRAARARPGFVDYVHRYLDEQTSPDAAEYIVECQLRDAGSVWVMPAGDNTQPAYSDRFASIDWGFLYDHQGGYEMMEDLRRQWAEHEAGFDYVLIDSRTGNTDIGGICTRQLPDTVVVMFVPTEQNVDGLAPIVERIREDSGERDRAIDLLFCPSNIPDLFDEDDILGRALKSAAERLGYGRPAELDPPVSRIHHWSSMEILDQPVTVLDRAHSKLANEYRELKTAIIGQNPADRDGAMATLTRLPAIYEAARLASRGQSASRVVERAAEIAKLHEDDGEIAYRAAAVFSAAKEFEKEERSLSNAIRSGLGSGRVRLLRAVARTNLSKREEALDDVRTLLSASDVTSFESRPAVQLLRALVDDPREMALELMRGPTTRARTKIDLAHLLMNDRRSLDAVADELLATANAPDMSDDLKDGVLNAAMLALIGAGRFLEAITIGERGEGGPNVAARFNTAIAVWGFSGEVPGERFALLDRELQTGEDDQNTHQCAALVRGVAGRFEEALSELAKSEDNVVPAMTAFSCWTFLQRSSEDFRADLDDMRKVLEAGAVPRPPFLGEA